MGCKPGKGRMAAMERLLTCGSHPKVTTEEATREKLAVQTIQREFCEADEANLLEEEDMHVFDSRPLTDPLHLVCCNTCKKPVKASQYAAHTERCRLSNSIEDVGLELDGGTGPKKPPRNGRKKLQTVHDNQGTSVGEQEKSDSIDGNNIAVSESNLDGLNRIVSSLSKEAKNTPAPLATKNYHSQGNQRLRAALAHLYREAVAIEHECAFLNPGVMQDVTMLSSQVSSNKMLHAAPKDDITQAKKDTYHPSGVQNPDQILAQSSELCLGTSRGYPSSMSFANQYCEGNSPRPGLTIDTAHVGMTRTRLHPLPYSFLSSSGATLGAMQQPNGIVPVV